MPATRRNEQIADENRAKVLVALEQAGMAGARAMELRNATGLSEKSVVYYCKTLPGVVRAGLTENHLVRWFHPSYVEGIQAYEEGLRNRKKPRNHRWSKETTERVIAHVIASGEAGSTSEEISKALGLGYQTARDVLRAAMLENRLQSLRWERNQNRYFGPAIEVKRIEAKAKAIAQERALKNPPKGHPRRAKPKHLHKRPGPKPGAPRTVVLKPSAKKPAPAPVAREVIVPADVKITVLPGFTGDRFKPAEVPRFFSAMAPGSYLRTGSAVEAAYARDEA